MKLLEIKNLECKFQDGTEALKDINFSVNKGDFIVIAGKNGSGKTVLLRHLNGLYNPTNGEIFFKGVSLKKQIRLVRQNVGLVFQNADSQIVSQTVWDDTAFGPVNLNLSKDEIKTKVTESLKSVGMFAFKDHNPHKLSGGEKRKIAIAGVLAMDTSIILLDEPFSNLDYPGIVDILKQIINLHKKGHTIICVTHEIEKILYHANRFIIMQDGYMVEDSTPVEVLKNIHKYDVSPPINPKGETIEDQLSKMTWLN